MNSTARIFPTVCCFGASGWDGVDAAGVCGLEGAAADGAGVVGSGEGGWAASWVASGTVSGAGCCAAAMSDGVASSTSQTPSVGS